MNRRALIIALFLAAAGALLLVLYMRRFEAEMSGGEPVTVLIAVKPIERGTVLSDDMLAERNVPTAYVEDRAIRAGEREKIVGLQASTPIYPQQALMWTDLAITTEDRDLSSLVQPGKRGFTVRASTGDDTRGNALIRPGDYVDVIVTLNDDSATGQRSVVLLQRILVLAVGFETKSAGAADARAQDNTGLSNEKVLTLSLNLKDSQLLALALEKGRLSVAIRNPQDQRVISEIPDMKSAALFDTLARSTTPGSGQGPRPVRMDSDSEQ
jgi:pilus assembly protein CpaB